jgi:hypothetical protein
MSEDPAMINTDNLRHSSIARFVQVGTGDRGVGLSIAE